MLLGSQSLPKTQFETKSAKIKKSSSEPRSRSSLRLKQSLISNQTTDRQTLKSENDFKIERTEQKDMEELKDELPALEVDAPI